MSRSLGTVLLLFISAFLLGGCDRSSESVGPSTEGAASSSSPGQPGSAAENEKTLVAATKPQNLLVLTIDTLRADALGAYGNSGKHTPQLDALAARSVVFENAYAPIATTFPSHSTLFTGVYPRLHGVRWNGHNLGDEWTTLAELLADRGYQTGAFVSYKAMVNRGGLGQGFSARSDPEVQPWDGARDGNATVAMAQEWMGEIDSEQPFFLWVHLFEPHVPYPLTDYASEAMGDYAGVFADGSDADEIHELPKGWADDPAEVAALRALYDGRVRDADAQVGRLFETLSELGLADRTMVAMLGDHGQLLGEHGAAGHGPVLFEEVLRVPLMLSDPTASVSAGRVAERVGLIDVMPTLLERLGEALPEGLQGRSLAPSMFGKSLSSRPYFAEVRVPKPEPGADADDQEDGAVAVFQGRYKLVVKGKQRKLYDLSRDPAEATSLSADLPDIVDELEAMAYRHQQLRELLDSVGSGELDDEALAELKALGYLK
ncbi:MAG: arylsulfatase A-like enzyme [Pseudohongiellaceae bacterium]|jgi:arylsulfatase A-like enzyme